MSTAAEPANNQYARVAGMPRVTVVVVHHNTPDYLHSCLRRVDEALGDLACEVVVVDNGSQGNGRPGIRSGGRLRVISNRENRGFAAAANQGAFAAAGEYLLFLNSEVKLTPRSVPALLAVLERNPGLAAVAPLAIGLEGRPRFPGMKFLNPWNHAASLIGLGGVAVLSRECQAQGGHLTEVDWISASTMLMRRRAFEGACGFDEHYFFYEEDEDLCWRLARQGHRVAVWGGTRVFDPGGVSTALSGDWPVAEFYLGQLRFVRRRWGRIGLLGYRGCMAFVLLAKLLLRWVMPRRSWRKGASMGRGQLALALRTVIARSHVSAQPGEAARAPR
ncbi:MAG TPA: glycosyltransferase family 2 protein [Deltaproteobacteria bacterium]|nr:glycosyltransferase family 2 protein [Deltaproteobacteria bacterium]